MSPAQKTTLKALMALWIVQISLVAVYLIAVWGDFGVPFDDAWIHFAFARNITEHGEVSFNAGQWSGGTTSLLWDVMLAAGYALSGDMVWASYVLGILGYLGTGAGFFLILLRTFATDRRARVLALLGTGALILTGFLPYLALSGMDSLLFLALSLGGIAAFLYGRYPLAGLLLAPLMLTRIEGLGVLAVVAVGAGLRHILTERLEVREIVAWLGPALVALAAYLIFNQIVSGHALPTTMVGRRWLWGFPETGPMFTWHRLQRYLQDWGILLYRFTFAAQLASLLGVTLLSVMGLVQMIRETLARRWELVLGSWLILAWIFGHNLAYVMMAPIASWRHQIPNVLLLPLLAVWGVHGLLSWGEQRRAVTTLALAAAILLIGYLPSFMIYRLAYAGNVHHINQVHVAAGKWVDEQLPPDAVIAAFDIGGVKYFGERVVLDLGGLTDGDFAPRYLYPATVPDYLKEMDATHLVMPEPAQPGQTDLKTKLGIGGAADDLTYRPLVSFEMPPYIPRLFEPKSYQFYPAYRKITIYEILASH